ncbi:MAG: hypothetical protein OEY34_06015 [Cyclobacteriaceae bacterium]|nr:hypothetical protein [Cyclobacteriaceae bacterium]
MKTTSYNPSTIEVDIANIITKMKETISSQMTDMEIVHIENNITQDNPLVRIQLVDNDGDPHEVVLKIIQVPDKF